MNARADILGVARPLPTRLVEKVWGRANLPAPFAAPANTRIGEIWFAPPPEMEDLLVKYLFTSEKLSVQVHPSVDNALAGEAGKEECWLVLDAKPGAKLAIGFDQSHSAQAIRAAARDGSIEELLTWHDARAGDIFYLPAGTVHAIGPGLALVEVQQNSDTTFRLYDYGRPRSLHLDRALAVADRGPYSAHHMTTLEQSGTVLVDGPHFRMDRIEGAPERGTAARYTKGVLALPLEGELRLKEGSSGGSGDNTGGAEAGEGAGAGDGDWDGGVTRSGGCLYAPSLSAIDFSAARVTLLTRSKG